MNALSIDSYKVSCLSTHQNACPCLSGLRHTHCLAINRDCYRILFIPETPFWTAAGANPLGRAQLIVPLGAVVFLFPFLDSLLLPLFLLFPHSRRLCRKPHHVPSHLHTQPVLSPRQRAVPIPSAASRESWYPADGWCHGGVGGGVPHMHLLRIHRRVSQARSHHVHGQLSLRDYCNACAVLRGNRLAKGAHGRALQRECGVGCGVVGMDCFYLHVCRPCVLGVYVV